MAKSHPLNKSKHRHAFRETPRRWLAATLVLLLGVFLLGSWIERRIDARALEQDAKLIAVMEQYAPDYVEQAIAALRQPRDPAQIARGLALLQRYGYQGSQDQVAVRAIFTAFMVFIMVFRGAWLSFTMRRAYRRARVVGQAYRSAKQSPPPAPGQEIAVRDAILDLSQQLKGKERTLRAVTDALLSQNMSQENFQKLSRNLARHMERLDSLAEDLVVLARQEPAAPAAQNTPPVEKPANPVE